jgi:Xaa-Pro aminopeptidase
MEDARAIKSKAEIEAMRCAIFACERSMQVMHERLEPGMSEQELWSHLHQQIIIRGGEWLETRLLTSGPRTNPWFQECSGRVIEAGDIVSFDTDLIGPYGYCADISRAWLCGDKKASATQKDLFARALEQIQRNTEILQVGVSFRELSETAASLPEDYISQRYSCLYHGVGLCDEYPSIKYQEDWESSGYDGVVQANMVLCVESYVGLPGGKEGVKLEEQVLVKEDGIEVLSQYPLSLYLS